jgi:hypothetical protein
MIWPAEREYKQTKPGGSEKGEQRETESDEDG